MNRFRLGVLVALAAVIMGSVPHPAAAADTNNFRISTYDIQYELSRSSEGRSVLKTTETITALFPDSDQNHGIEREIPRKYNGHSTSLVIDAVTDGQGRAQQYKLIRSDDGAVTTVRIGNPDTYVHGTHTYVLSYTQQDVTRFYENTQRDEWYWDTNGVNWRVPIDTLNVSVTLADAIAKARTGDPYCYYGVSGATDKCQIAAVSTGVGDATSQYTATATGLQARENVTLAFGFHEGTFANYTPSFWEQAVAVWVVVTLATGILGMVIYIGLTVAYYRRRNRQKELHTIPVQYIPPKNTSPTIAAQVITPLGSVFGAQLIDLAVRHIIAIIETAPAKTFQTAKYDIEMKVDADGQLEEVREILQDMWGHVPKAGERLALSSLKNNMSFYARTADNDKKTTTLVEGRYGLREKNQTTSRYFYRWAIGLLIAGLVLLSPPLLLFAGLTSLFGVMIRPLTDTGLELRRYLLGLSTYIKAAEAERLKFLQGPDTAEKVGERVDTANPGQIVKLYERVLPYAVLFGQEKQWTKQLGDYYTEAQSQPSWYQGSTSNSVFNAAVFASAMQSFTSSVSASSDSSSSSGGSSGSGSSGGGGGGGGGGGW